MWRRGHVDARARARKPERGKAQGRIDRQVNAANARAFGQLHLATRTADGSEAQKPTSTRPRFAIALSLTLTQSGRGESTRRKSIGSDGAMKRHVGPDVQRCRSTRRGSKPAKG
jgi:hypothetical protein